MKIYVIWIILFARFLTVCGSCNEGWFGTKCELNCSPLCVGGCEKADGRCSHCPPRRTGTQCESCPQCKDNECHPNGTCKIACADPTMHGDDCDRRCSDSIAGCTECHPDGTCKVCTRGFFISGSTKSCSSCSGRDQLCLACKDLFDCEECISGYYQENGKCKKCPVNCVECTSEKSCSKCEVGWQGLTCKCGKNCTQEVTTQVSDWCSQENGTCLKGCVVGKYTSDCKTDCPPLDGSCLICDQTDGNCFECVPGRYGKYRYGHQFNSSCSEMCGQCADGRCVIDNGACSGQCIVGYYGAKCTLTCTENCNSCEKDTGKCYECKTGFYMNMSTGFCQQCKAGYYGDKCEDRCSDQCAKNVLGLICEQADGRCRNCPVGMYGKFCDLPCAGKCINPLNRHTVGDCHQITSECVHGCQEGYHSNLCNMSCNTRCKGQQCDIDTAKCLNGCEEGFNGEYCSQEMPKSDDAGVIIGVVVALIVLIMSIAVVIFIICRRKKSQKRNADIPLRNMDTYDDVDRNLLSNNDDSEYTRLFSKVPTQTFIDIVRKRTHDDPGWIMKEFKRLPMGLNLAESARNIGPIGDSSVPSIEWTGIKLTPDGRFQGDYPHAAFVTGYKKPEAFIASQVPTEATVNDFWRMIWQKDCDKIVLLTNLEEEIKKPCFCFWPEHERSATFGNLVIHTSEVLNKTFAIRSLSATHNITRVVKEFTLYHFTCWPSYGTAGNPGELLKLRERVTEDISKLIGAIVVLCSSGIGKTGAFIALDYVIRQAKEEKAVDVFQAVSNLRQIIPTFVESEKEYEYLYSGVIEVLTANVNVNGDFAATKLCPLYMSLLEKDKERLEDPSQVMAELSPVATVEDSSCNDQSESSPNDGAYSWISDPK